MVNRFLPRSYVERYKPEPFPDEDDGISWQCGVYEFAMSLYDDGVSGSIVDVGCGRARKLKRICSVKGAPPVGYDCDDTVAWLKKNEPWLDARAVDLEKGDIRIDPGSLVICADVVEHLFNPDQLMLTLAYAADEGSTVIISTPDRVLHYGPDHLGPPLNRAHVREWSLPEFQLYCESFKRGFRGGEYFYTQTHDKSPAKHTITAVFR